MKGKKWEEKMNENCNLDIVSIYEENNGKTADNSSE